MFSIPEPLQVIINFMSLILCLCCGWLLVRLNRLSQSTGNPSHPQHDSKEPLDFIGDVNLAQLNQELNQSFSSLTQNVEDQHLHLSALIERTNSPSVSPPVPASVSKAKTSLPSASSAPSPHDAKEEVLELHQQGLQISSIAAQLKIPRAEVELMIKMAGLTDTP